MLKYNPDFFERYSCMLSDVNTRADSALYSFHVFVIRRLYFCVGMIVWHQSKHAQIIV